MKIWVVFNNDNPLKAYEDELAAQREADSLSRTLPHPMCYFHLHEIELIKEQPDIEND